MVESQFPRVDRYNGGGSGRIAGVAPVTDLAKYTGPLWQKIGRVIDQEIENRSERRWRTAVRVHTSSHTDDTAIAIEESSVIAFRETLAPDSEPPP